MEFVKIKTSSGEFEISVENMRSFLIDSMGFDNAAESDIKTADTDELIYEIEEGENIEFLLEWCGYNLA